jgi:hypothetical protein
MAEHPLTALYRKHAYILEILEQESAEQKAAAQTKAEAPTREDTAPTAEAADARHGAVADSRSD